MDTAAEDLIPKNFDYQEAQPRIYAQWLEEGCFDADEASERPPYVIVIPPPNVTGALHLGHALNNTLQDIQIRMKRMQGFNALWMPGTDHAGIATQAVVERRLKEEEGKTRHDLGREQLVDRIWQWKDQYEARILGQLKQMGCSCDWRRVRFTLDDQCARAVRRTFFDLFRQSRIYRGKRLVNWDTFLQTAVSDDEVFQETVKGSFWRIRYPVIDPQPGEPSHVTVATTRPETLLGDTAVAVHPDPEAALDEAEQTLAARLEKAPEKERAALEQQLEQLRERRQAMTPSLIQMRDMAADGRCVMLPLMNRPIPLVADEWAKPEMGSGAVKITPAHDPNDYEVGKRRDLPMVNILNPDGTLNANAGTYSGLTIKKARKQVVADLEQAELLESVEDREIELPHSDRSKTPIEPYLADQWFVRMDELAQSAMDAVTDGRVVIHPERYSRGYLDWLGEKRDWPVSRQLWWGHRIPVWSMPCASQQELDSAVSKLQADPEQGEAMAFQVEHPETSGDAADGPYAWLHVCLVAENADLEQRIEAIGLTQVDDVLDTWFSSALWTHSTLGWPENTEDLRTFYPTSTLITSRDIISLWVARMVLMGLNNLGQPPFRDVFIHPKILDGDGETMSKSKGNGIDPIDVIQRFGADSLRYAMAHLTTDKQDVRMPVEFECPHCQALIKQTKKNRVAARVPCTQCGQPFSTQWAEKEEDKQLPRGAVISERFEQARNFCNKLWNASRFALLNLSDYEAGPLAESDLQLEDRWLLSRLNTITKEVTEALEAFRYSDAARALYAFAWDEFCSAYVEMLKDRFQDPQLRPAAQRVLAWSLDQLLRLLHPIMPFISEEIWRLLGEAAPRRGLGEPVAAAPLLVGADWPTADGSRIDADVERKFAYFQSVLGAVREIRSRQNIPPKAQVAFQIRCPNSRRDDLESLMGYFPRLAGSECTQCDEQTTPPAIHAAVSLADSEVYVDLKDYIDVEAEQARLSKQIEKSQQQVAAKEKKLANENFVSRAPEDVVRKERESLEQLREQIRSMQEALTALASPDA